MSAETIVALSSGQLPAGVAVVRASGPAVRSLMLDIAGMVPDARRVHYGPLRDQGGAIIDRGLTVFFEAPASFTGEDVVEFHVHGSRAVVAALIQSCCSNGKARPAEAGEFMQRAFLHGKVSLLEAEATADLIKAETEAQRRFAVSVTADRYKALYEEWRQTLIETRALLESELDFADEADIPDRVSDLVWPRIRSLTQEVETHRNSHSKAEILRNGLDVVLLGVPNSGKSTLLNALVSREAALVSDEAGTTRDLVEVALDLNGAKVKLTDTAGIRDADGKVEQMGIERALGRARSANVVLLVAAVETGDFLSYDAQPGQAVLRIGTKSDLGAAATSEIDLVLSAHSGEGLDLLKWRLEGLAMQALPTQQDLVPWKERHITLLSTAIVALERAVDPNLPLELNSEELRVATDAIGQIADAVSIEHLYDSIFSQFCIGK